jgi:hypothetical protein
VAGISTTHTDIASRIPTEYWINGGIRGGRIAMKKLDKRTAMDAA